MNLSFPSGTIGPNEDPVNASSRATAIAKIMFSHIQTVSIAAAFDLRWPASTLALFAYMQSMTTIGNDALSLDCLLQTASNPTVETMDGAVHVGGNQYNDSSRDIATSPVEETVAELRVALAQHVAQLTRSSLDTGREYVHLMPGKSLFVAKSMAMLMAPLVCAVCVSICWGVLEAIELYFSRARRQKCQLQCSRFKKSWCWCCAC